MTEEVRVGVVGVEGAAWSEALQDGAHSSYGAHARVVATVGCESLMSGSGDREGTPNPHKQLSSMLDGEKLDGVVLGRSSSNLADAVGLVLEAGLHLLVDPRALVPGDTQIESILVAAERCRRVVVFGYDHGPLLNWSRECLRRGMIGTLTSITATWWRSTKLVETSFAHELRVMLLALQPWLAGHSVKLSATQHAGSLRADLDLGSGVRLELVIVPSVADRLELRFTGKTGSLSVPLHLGPGSMDGHRPVLYTRCSAPGEAGLPLPTRRRQVVDAWFRAMVGAGRPVDGDSAVELAAKTLLADTLAHAIASAAGAG